MDYDKILNLLHHREVVDAFHMIMTAADELKDWEITSETETLRNTYEQMLSYMTRGFIDPQGDKIREDIIERLAYVVYKMIRLHKVHEHPTGLFAMSYKQAKNIPSLENAVTSLEENCASINNVLNDEMIGDGERDTNLSNLYNVKEAVLASVFSYAWTSIHWQCSDLDQANRLLFSDVIDANDKCVFLSAITLSLLEVPDKSKLLLLLDSYLISDAVVSQRALIGFILAYITFDDFYNTYQEIADRLSVYGTGSDFADDVCIALSQLQMTSQTDKVADILKDTIMPNVLGEKNNLGGEGLRAMLEQGENPAWLDEKVEGAVQDMYMMTREGVDMHYPTVGKYKQCNFFQRTTHWFYLFSTDVLNYVGKCRLTSSNMKTILNMMLSHDQLCDSDKYSMCFMMTQLNMINPDDNIQFAAKIQAEADAAEISSEEMKSKRTASIIRRGYIQDLYRFFMLSRHAGEFGNNPFLAFKKDPLTPLKYKWTKKLIAGNTKRMLQYADFLMRYDFYQQALDVFRHVAEYNDDLNDRDVGIWKKVGFCYESLGQKKNAHDAYRVAEGMSLNSKWILNHMVRLEKSLGYWRDVERHSAQLAKLNPKNAQHLMDIGEACIKMSKYDEVLPLMYKICYVTDKMSEYVMLIFVLIGAGQTDRAEQELDKLIMKDADATEKKKLGILLGICHLLKGRFADGYAACEKGFDEDTEGFFNKCCDMILNQKFLDLQTLTLFKDALRMHIKPMA